MGAGLHESAPCRRNLATRAIAPRRERFPSSPALHPEGKRVAPCCGALLPSPSGRRAGDEGKVTDRDAPSGRVAPIPAANTDGHTQCDQWDGALALPGGRGAGGEGKVSVPSRPGSRSSALGTVSAQPHQGRDQVQEREEIAESLDALEEALHEAVQRLSSRSWTRGAAS